MINAQSLKDRLQTVARERNIPFNTCWKQVLLERFLARLANSEHSNKFIFKGGCLLAYLIKIGRETVDLDFLLNKTKAQQDGLRHIFEQIISVYSEDGFTFSFNSMKQLNQPHMNYRGYRIALKIEQQFFCKI
jgi:predicted nucleotidyltransferase component of viral defense system